MMPIDEILQLVRWPRELIELILTAYRGFATRHPAIRDLQLGVRRHDRISKVEMVKEHQDGRMMPTIRDHITKRDFGLADSEAQRSIEGQVIAINRCLPNPAAHHNGARGS